MADVPAEASEQARAEQARRMMDRLRREGVYLGGQWYHQLWPGHWHYVLGSSGPGYFFGSCRWCNEHAEEAAEAMAQYMTQAAARAEQRRPNR
jgi:hypothetical protein